MYYVIYKGEGSEYGPGRLKVVNTAFPNYGEAYEHAYEYSDELADHKVVAVVNGSVNNDT